MPQAQTYDPNFPLIGFDGSEHDSEAEAKESFVYGPIGVYRCTETLPVPFSDPVGVPFQRKPDFRADRPRYSVYVEFKTYLNDQPDKATAKAAEAGYRPPGRTDQWHIAETSWSNSGACNAIVQQTLGSDSIVMVFPDEIFKPVTRGERKGKLREATVRTLNRLDKHGIFWLKSSQLRGYLAVRDLVAKFRLFIKPQPPQEQPHTVQIWCRTSEMLAYKIDEIKAQGYRLKRGSSTETSAVLILKKSPASVNSTLH